MKSGSAVTLGRGEVTGELNLGLARGDRPRGDLLMRLVGRLGRDSRPESVSRRLSVEEAEDLVGRRVTGLEGTCPGDKGTVGACLTVDITLRPASIREYSSIAYNTALIAVAPYIVYYKIKSHVSIYRSLPSKLTRVKETVT